MLQTMVRCGVCRSQFDEVAELFEHRRHCDVDRPSDPARAEVRLTPVGRDESPVDDRRRPVPVSNPVSNPVDKPATGSGRTAGAVMSHPVVTVRQDDVLWTAWGLLYGADYRHLVVVDYHRRPVGVLDEQTLTREWPAGPVAPHRQRVYDLVSGRNPPAVGRDDDLAEVATLMLRSGADAVPVVDGSGRLLGLVTTRHMTELVSTGRRGRG